ncbi:hypothetical protein DSECCO2_562210 [anaerobic digester metagenome]
MIEIEQEIALATSSQTNDDFHHSVFPSSYKFLKVIVTLDYHCILPYLEVARFIELLLNEVYRTTLDSASIVPRSLYEDSIHPVQEGFIMDDGLYEWNSSKSCPSLLHSTFGFVPPRIALYSHCPLPIAFGSFSDSFICWKLMSLDKSQTRRLLVLQEKLCNTAIEDLIPVRKEDAVLVLSFEHNHACLLQG